MTPPPHIARHVWVKGRVQGVAFRHHTRGKATSLGLAGWVRNLADGRVEAWIEGPPAAIQAMLAWLRRGPLLAKVLACEIQEAESEGRTGFEILR